MIIIIIIIMSNINIDANIDINIIIYIQMISMLTMGVMNITTTIVLIIRASKSARGENFIPSTVSTEAADCLLTAYLVW